MHRMVTQVYIVTFNPIAIVKITAQGRDIEYETHETREHRCDENATSTRDDQGMGPYPSGKHHEIFVSVSPLRRSSTWEATFASHVLERKIKGLVLVYCDCLLLLAQ
jgi:hypothetical protein